MKVSIKEIIDDILLLVRNNNISESEDLSRAQIAAWIKHYRNWLWKLRKDAIKDRYKNGQFMELEDLVDEEVLTIKEIDAMELEECPEAGKYTKRTVDTLDDVFMNNGISILSIHDRDGEIIQYMDHVRRHYDYNRKYTFAELTGFFKDDGHIYIQGYADGGVLKYITVMYIAEENEDNGENDDNLDEEDIEVPTWMVPDIKDKIMKNELSFMLNRPSDDSNNATLASVKPHGPQDDEE